MKQAFIRGSVITGTADSVVKRADVLVEDGRIAFVGDGAKQLISDHEIVDCSGKYIMPGLINMHAHLFGTGKPSKVLGGGGSQKAVLSFIGTRAGRRVLDKLVAASVQAELDSGVTTLRSVGDFHNSDLRIRDKVRAGKLPGPRMYCSGPAITVPGGHGDGTFAETSASAGGLAALVDKRCKDGADFIKICITGGVMDAKVKGSPGELKMNLKQTMAVCDRAHALGLKVAAHTESPEGMEVALEGGVDTIEHGAPFDEAHGLLLKERAGGVILTFSPALPLAKLPPEITKLPELCVYNSQVVMDGMAKGGGKARALGIQVGMGTDASCPFVTQYGMWREVLYYHKMMGGTKAEAIYRATLANAEILEIDDRTGSVEQGKYADLLILHENPLKNLQALEQPFAVVKEGVLRQMPVKKNRSIERELDQLLATL